MRLLELTCVSGADPFTVLVNPNTVVTISGAVVTEGGRTKETTEIVVTQGFKVIKVTESVDEVRSAWEAAMSRAA